MSEPIIHVAVEPIIHVAVSVQIGDHSAGVTGKHTLTTLLEQIQRMYEDGSPTKERGELYNRLKCQAKGLFFQEAERMKLKGDQA